MKQLDPKAVWLFFFSSVFSWIFLIVIFSVWGGGFFGSFNGVLTFNNKVVDPSELIWSITKIVTVLSIIPTYVGSRLTYHFYRYELTDIGFKKESGIIWKRYVTIPYDRIQNVDINRGLLARILGLSDLQIHTAGVGGVAMGEGKLPGLSKADAEVMRDELVNRSRQSRNGQGL